MTQQQTQAFAGIRERKGLIDAAIISSLLWMLLIVLVRIAARIV